MTYKQYISREATPIDPEAVGKFDNEVNTLAKRRFGVDYDSWCPVQVIVIDRSRHQAVHVMPIKHTMSLSDSERRAVAFANLRAAQCNLSTAQRQMDQAIWEVADLEEKRVEQWKRTSKRLAEDAKLAASPAKETTPETPQKAR